MTLRILHENRREIPSQLRIFLLSNTFQAARAASLPAPERAEMGNPWRIVPFKTYRDSKAAQIGAQDFQSRFPLAGREAFQRVENPVLR